MRFILALSLACGAMVFTVTGHQPKPAGGAQLVAGNPFAEARK